MPDRRRRALRDVRALIACPKRRRRVERHAVGDVAAQHVMGAGLVGEHVHLDAALRERLECWRRVHHHTDRLRTPLAPRLLGKGEPRIQRCGLHVAIPRGQPLVDTRFIHVEGEDHGAVHRGGERLRPTHAAEPRRDNEAARERAAEVALRDRAERLVRALHDPLRTDVDPGAGSHLPVHHQPLALELAEVLPGGPAPDEIGVRDEHARGTGVRAEHRNRFSALHEQRLVILQRAQRRHDRVEGLPAARGAPRAAIHHQLVRSFSDVRIEVVHQHSKGRLLLPSLARDHASARCAYRPRARRRGRVGAHPALTVAVKWPRAIASARIITSVESTRS